MAPAERVLAQLQASKSEPIVAHSSRRTGVYNFVKAPAGAVLAPAKAGGGAGERALSFLSENGALIGLNDRERVALGQKTQTAKGSTLQELKSHTDALGETHVKFDQYYQGLKVFGAQVVVHLNDTGVTGLSGDFVPEVSLSTVPALSAAEAGENAIRILRKSGGGNDLMARKTDLGIYPHGLLEGTAVSSRLAYAVEINGERLTEQVWVDAQTGAILIRIPLRHTALNRVVYTPEYGEPFDVRHEGDPLTPGPTPGTTGADPINNLYVFAGHSYNLLKSGFGRDSYDGLGHVMESVLLINNQCPNAYWNGISTNYCPDFDSDDVVSHEWGHAYTQFTHNLIYAYQSGALNESYSDILGETADLLNGVDAEGGANNTQPPPAGQRWQVGEDVNGFNQPALGILRDMWTPTSYGQPDKSTSPNYSCGAGDGGGVHANSGVPNHAFAMLVDGKTFNGQTVAAIGFDRALAIYYRAMTVYQTPTTDFATHSQALQASCTDLIGQPLNVISATSGASVVSADTISATTCEQVTKAMLAVEMDNASPCPSIILLDPNTPPICNGATDVYTENWETGDDGWTRTSTGLTADWEDSTRNLRDFVLDGTLPAGRAGTAAQARNIPIGEPGGGTCTPGGDYSGQYTFDSPAILVPAGASDLKMSFDHYVATETGFDGGQVEISVNGGAFALVPDGNYVFNRPNAPFMSAVDGNTNPNAGEPAWHGTNINTPSGQPPGSWGTTIIDLAPLTNPGDTIKIRFTYSQDGCNGVDGWYVDNIRVYACPVLTPPTLSLGPDYENPDTNGSYTVNWTRPPGAIGPDVLQVSQTSCAPLIADDAEGGTGQWTIASTPTPPAPMWQVAPPNQKPGYASTSFWANPVSEQQTQGKNSTLTFANPITIPSAGLTKLSFMEWYFNEDDDMGLVEVSTDNGATWTAIYTNARPMGDLPDQGADAFATEGLTRQELDLTIYSGQTIRLRFRYQLGGSNFFAFLQYGWYVDNIRLENENFTDLVTTSATSFTHSGLSNGTRCYRVRTTYPGTVASAFSSIISAIVNQVTACPPPPFVDDLEPNQDAGWGFQVAQNNQPSPTWALVTDPQAHSPTHSFMSDGAAADIKDDRLISPPQNLTATSRLIFWHKFITEDGFDGGVLEVSTDGGATWVDVGQASFITGGYNGTIDTGFNSPIAGRQAWTGLSAAAPEMSRVEVNLGAFAGDGVRVRWRMALDDGVLVPGVGWWVDDIQFTNLACPALAPIPTAVVSRKVHGAAGTFDINVFGPGAATECRTGGPSQIVLSFAAPITFTGAAVSSGTGTVSSSSGSGTTEAIINLTGVTNQQNITVSLLGVNGTTAEVPVQIGVLLGDTTPNRMVNSADIAETKASSGTPTSATNFRNDVTANGVVNGSDVGAVKSQSGANLP